MHQLVSFEPHGTSDNGTDCFTISQALPLPTPELSTPGKCSRERGSTEMVSPPLESLLLSGGQHAWEDITSET
jgi:hypothetical protein